MKPASFTLFFLLSLLTPHDAWSLAIGSSDLDIREYYKLAAPNVGLDPTPEQVKHYYIRAAERLGKGTILKDVRTDVTDRPSPEEIKPYYVRVAAEHEKFEKRKATKVDPEIIKRYYVRAAEVALS
ncbi:hypothetical protein C8Q75DRAFT_395662 [Abortiporus biennis]|nr:hypothetical protein C8Q75DRAFT_395662 [Abortiporus biennis]